MCRTRLWGFRCTDSQQKFVVLAASYAWRRVVSWNWMGFRTSVRLCPLPVWAFWGHLEFSWCQLQTSARMIVLVENLPFLGQLLLWYFVFSSHSLLPYPPSDASEGFWLPLCNRQCQGVPPWELPANCAFLSWEASSLATRKVLRWLWEPITSAAWAKIYCQPRRLGMLARNRKGLRLIVKPKRLWPLFSVVSKAKNPSILNALGFHSSRVKERIL